MMVDDQDYHDSRFFREWVNPQGLGDSIGFPVLKTERHFGCWIASRREISPRYRERDVGLLASLAPDVCRAFQLRVIVRNQEIQLNGLKSCLGVLASGVCLIDRYAHIIYMNTSAERQIKAGRGFCVERGRITPVDSEARHLFGQAITDMFAHHDQNARMTTVAIPDGSRVGVVATLLPLHLEKDYLRDVADGVVALFMQDPLVAVTLPGEAFSKLYELTDCERRVLLSLVSGSCVKATAELLGVSETTVKSHLSHIFSKTQTSKQAELIQLFLSFVPPIHSAKAG
ncbi:MAG: helix-turn-helix transcriptional regulator [Hyphomicrobium sp.]